MSSCGCSDPGGASRGNFIYSLGGSGLSLHVMQDPASIVEAKVNAILGHPIVFGSRSGAHYIPVEAHYVAAPTTPPTANCCE